MSFRLYREHCGSKQVPGSAGNLDLVSQFQMCRPGASALGPSASGGWALAWAWPRLGLGTHAYRTRVTGQTGWGDFEVFVIVFDMF